MQEKQNQAIHLHLQWMLQRLDGVKLPLTSCLRMNLSDAHFMLKKFMIEFIRFSYDYSSNFNNISKNRKSKSYFHLISISCLSRSGNIYTSFTRKTSRLCLSSWNGGKRISVFFTHWKRCKRAPKASHRHL